MFSRSDGRRPDELRPARIIPDFIPHAEGSVLIECGATRIVCTATCEEKVPHFRRGTGSGWVTAEYGMLPRSTATRMVREVSRGRASGRTQEIQRIIGRALRSVVDLDALGERTIWVDCDVIQADGGTRTAAITGAFVALALAIEKIRLSGQLEQSPLLDHVAAVSVGMVGDEPLLDLAYEEDVSAQVDMNVVMTGHGSFVEVQGTAEGKPFDRRQLDRLLELAQSGIDQLLDLQRRTLADRMRDGRTIPPGENVAPRSGDSE